MSFRHSASMFAAFRPMVPIAICLVLISAAGSAQDTEGQAPFPSLFSNCRVERAEMETTTTADLGLPNIVTDKRAPRLAFVLLGQALSLRELFGTELSGRVDVSSRSVTLSSQTQRSALTYSLFQGATTCTMQLYLRSEQRELLTSPTEFMAGLFGGLSVAMASLIMPEDSNTFELLKGGNEPEHPLMIDRIYEAMGRPVTTEAFVPAYIKVFGAPPPGALKCEVHQHFGSPREVRTGEGIETWIYGPTRRKPVPAELIMDDVLSQKGKDTLRNISYELRFSGDLLEGSERQEE